MRNFYLVMKRFQQTDSLYFTDMSCTHNKLYTLHGLFPEAKFKFFIVIQPFNKIFFSLILLIMQKKNCVLKIWNNKVHFCVIHLAVSRMQDEFFNC